MKGAAAVALLATAGVVTAQSGACNAVPVGACRVPGSGRGGEGAEAARWAAELWNAAAAAAAEHTLGGWQEPGARGRRAR